MTTLYYINFHFDAQIIRRCRFYHYRIVGIQNPFEWVGQSLRGAAEVRRSTYVSMLFADGLVLDRHRAISNNHAFLTVSMTTITWITLCNTHALAHWGRVTHIFVSDLPIIGSDNGLSPDRRQVIISTNAGILLIGPLGANFNDILFEIRKFSFTKMHLKMSSAKWRPFSRPQCVNKLCSREVWRLASRWFLCYMRVRVLTEIVLYVQWNLSVTTTSLIKSITCDLFSNVF